MGDEPAPMITCRVVWKVFGPKAERVVGSPDVDLPRVELDARTGCVAAVRDVSFDVAEDGVFVVTGLSGSGKSTFIRCFSRLTEPTAGEVKIDGRDVLGLNAGELRELRRTRLSMVFQNFGLLPHRRALDNIAFGLEVQGMGKAERIARATEMLDPVGLGSVGESYPRRAVRRDAAAGRSRACARERPGDPSLRRAVFRAGPADPAGHAGRGRPAATRAAQDGRVHHPRPRRGAQSGGPDRDHAGSSIAATTGRSSTASRHSPTSSTFWRHEVRSSSTS